MAVNRDILETLGVPHKRMYWYRSEWREGPIEYPLSRSFLVRRSSDPSQAYRTVGVTANGLTKDSWLMIKRTPSGGPDGEAIHRMKNGTGIEYLVTEIIGDELPSRGIID